MDIHLFQKPRATTCFKSFPVCIRLLPKPGYKEMGFRQISLKIYILFHIETHKQYSLLDTIFDYIFYFGPQGKYFFHVQSDNHMRINSSVNRKHMFDLTTQTNNTTLQAGLIVIKMKLNEISVIDGTMIENVTTSQQD